MKKTVKNALTISRQPRQPTLPGMRGDSAQTISSSDQRLLDAAAAIYGEDVAELRYLHVVLAQCGLPYREVKQGTAFYEKTNGRTSLVLTPGVLLDPKTRKPTIQGIPYGAKPRLLMIHLCTAAKLQKTPEVEIAHSMSAFMRDLGLAVTGGKTGSIARFKEQLNRLAATRMQLLFQDDDKVSMLNPSSPIQRYDVWFPKSPNQRMLWPTTVTLGTDFFASLMSENAMPLDARAIRALQQSAMALDVYTWLAHRLCRIPRSKPAVISWDALQLQFGPEYASSKKFRDDFRATMRRVQAVYRAANIGQTDDGRVELRRSDPPVAKATSLLK
jgi:hypothetical protein